MPPIYYWRSQVARKTKEEAQRTRQQIIDAAREVFHKHGVANSSLEQVASAANLTRGAVYWHFKDKAELFCAIREDVFTPMTEQIDTILFSDDYADPLDAIEVSLKAFFKVLDDNPVLRQVLEIMISRCELVDEYAEVQAEVERPSDEFLEKVGKVYKKAAAQGVLRSDLEPAAMALDTWVFVKGQLHLQLATGFDKTLKKQVPEMITAHVALRRPC